MKIFNWMHRKLHSSNNYSQVSQDEDVEEKAVVETDTDALLLHDMLKGILTIGTLGHHHHLVPEAYFDSEGLLGEDGEVIEEVEEAGFFEVAREASAAVLNKIKLSVEDEEKKIMEVVQVHEVQGSEKILELPLLKEHTEKKQRRRTTLADLLAANAVNDNDSAAKTVPDGTNVRGKQQAINSKNNMQHKQSKGDQKPPATTTTTGKLQTLIPRMLKKKIHPEMAEPKEEALKERNKAKKPPMAGQAASSAVATFSDASLCGDHNASVTWIHH
ncbi:hypothetical protein OPV22_030932 [Ensete ventricosum]|uniref:Protein TILLER ANGLE CONTROL 1 n=1 Tax=Ensete ventricosum TaxID=4639 RepID=A0AAV8NYY5_ENSVE|nr:hypothetical protein OPV22_030932 [Ensete ventricosum]